MICDISGNDRQIWNVIILLKMCMEYLENIAFAFIFSAEAI